MAANPRLGFPMDAIPTPRTEAAQYDATYGFLRKTFVCDVKFAEQLERELTIAKQALEKIVQERFYPMSKRLTTAEGLAENALQEIKNLSK